MANRTFAIGDVHGELQQLFTLLASFPELDAADTIVFVGDYLDRGPQSAQVLEYVRTGLPAQTPARVVALRGNHEDAWLKVVSNGWNAFVDPPGNGCLATLRSYLGGPPPVEDEAPRREELQPLRTGSFFPMDVLDWMGELPYWYEDEHAIYVHAGLTKHQSGRWSHPSELDDKTPLLWLRTEEFFVGYRGKRVVFGHTATECLPQELSQYTPEDPTDVWAGENVIGIDTGCGNGGFLTAIELPALNVYESRR